MSRSRVRRSGQPCPVARVDCDETRAQGSRICAGGVEGRSQTRQAAFLAAFGGGLWFFGPALPLRIFKYGATGYWGVWGYGFLSGREDAWISGDWAFTSLWALPIAGWIIVSRWTGPGVRPRAGRGLLWAASASCILAQLTVAGVWTVAESAQAMMAREVPWLPLGSSEIAWPAIAFAFVVGVWGVWLMGLLSAKRGLDSGVSHLPAEALIRKGSLYLLCLSLCVLVLCRLTNWGGVGTSIPGYTGVVIGWFGCFACLIVYAAGKDRARQP